MIIPVLNEAQTVSDVVAFARRSPFTDEVLVIDDASTDGTPEIARAAGARVITSRVLGKGISMEEGVRLAANEVLVYLDGDLKGLDGDLIERLSNPIFDLQADFVKAKFRRAAGRVTVLTARPLLRMLFPELARFEQPLSGIIAAKRSLLSTLRFENDYGVDIGLLIDAAAAKARIVEVDIGHIDHTSQPLEALEEMATQVARTVIERASRFRNRKSARLRAMTPLDVASQAGLPRFPDRLPSDAEPLAV